ncbi:DUF6114 domain-containing protein, partial [Corynebacterium heidelbergense]
MSANPNQGDAAYKDRSTAPSPNETVPQTPSSPALDRCNPVAAEPDAKKQQRSRRAAQRKREMQETNRGFTAWRRNRPFGGGLLMIMAGLIILTPAYLTFEVADIQIAISSLSGVSTLLIGVLLIACGSLTWFKADGRILWSIAALILALVSMPTANLGGFIIGALLGIIGAALTLAWTDMPKESRAERGRRKNAKSQPQAEGAEAQGIPSAAQSNTEASDAAANRASVDHTTAKHGAVDAPNGAQDTRPLGAKPTSKKHGAITNRSHAVALVAVMGSIALISAQHLPAAQAQLPPIPGLENLFPPANQQQPGQDNPGQPGAVQPSDSPQPAPGIPGLPGLPPLPPLPQVAGLPTPGS